MGFLGHSRLRNSLATPGNGNVHTCAHSYMPSHKLRSIARLETHYLTPSNMEDFADPNIVGRRLG